MAHVSMFYFAHCSCGAQGFALALLRRHYSARLRLNAARYRLGLRLFSACAIKDCSAHFAYASFATAVIDGLFSSRSSRLSNSPRLTHLVRPTLTRTCSSQLRVSFAHLCTRLHSLSAAALSSFDLCFAPVGISRQCARLSYVAYR